MGMSRTWVLKGSLWIQAVFLLVLTSILADTNAWIGAILTGTGLFFVVIGIIAAHKRRIGYLYIYATLVGLWQILALTHILIICGLITLPTNKFNPAFIVGQKIVEDPSYPLKIAIPVLYGLQWCSWCVALVCMVSLRLETVDPTHGFEIQDPKQQRHSLNTTSRYSRNNTSTSLPNFGGNSSTSGSSSSNPRMNQHLFNFRQSVIAPIGGDTSIVGGSLKHNGGASSSASSNSRSTESAVSSGIGVGADGHSSTRMIKGKEPMDKGRYVNDCEMPQAPERSWVGMERRASSDSNVIFIPNDPRISQVVVTFKDDAQDTPQQEYNSRSFASVARSKQQQQQQQQIPEATTIYITNHHYGQSSSSNLAVSDGHPSNSQTSTTATGLGARSGDSYILNYSASGESFSDMIFKSPQNPINLPLTPLPAAKPTTTASHSSKSLPHPSPLQQPVPKEISGFHSHSCGDSTPNPARIRGTATKVSLTLSSDSSSSELSALSNGSSSDSEELLEFAPPSTTRVIPKSDQAERSLSQPLPSSHPGPEGVVAGLAMTSVDPLNIIPKSQSQQQNITASETKSFSDPENESYQYASHGPSGGDEYYSPQAQPNSSDSSHSLSSLSSTSTRPRNDDRSERGQISGKAPSADAHPILEITTSPTTATTLSQPQPPSASASASQQQTPASPSPFNYTPAPFTPFPIAATGSVSVTPTTATATSARTKSHRVSLPLHYWRSRISQPPPPSINTSLPSSSSQPVDGFSPSPSSSSPASPPQSSTSTSSFTQNYLTNPFLLPKKKKIQLPTIVIHADDEDGEPPRVLSPQDIEYLTTMPPVPLRPLIQPWDEEEDEVFEDTEDVYDEIGVYDAYNEYPHPHQLQQVYHQQEFQHQSQQQYWPQPQQRRSYNGTDLEEGEYNEREREQELIGIRDRIDEVQRNQQQQGRRISQYQQDFEHVRAMQLRLSKEGGVDLDQSEEEQDPYALDVPIDVGIDRDELEGLEKRKKWEPSSSSSSTWYGRL
ncbi:hypothetical protein EC991_008603 [Linnemannia zychae]|nr:hypothetical protein EC991_008603 [Linnemannia zychae]